MKLIKCQWQKMMYVGGKNPEKKNRKYFFSQLWLPFVASGHEVEQTKHFFMSKSLFCVCAYTHTQTFGSPKEFSRSSGSTELSVFWIVDEDSKFLHEFLFFLFFLMVRRHNHRLVDAQVGSNSCVSTAPKQCSKLTIMCVRCIYSFRPDLP